MINSDWSAIGERVRRLSAHAHADQVFGANHHRWELQAPLTTDELAEAEAQLRAELPGEYRAFLLQVSRGGAGPAYGLFPLQRAGGWWRWDGEGADLTDGETLAQPFAHTDAFNPADGLPEPPEPDTFGSEAAFNEAEDAYWEQHDATVFVADHAIGLLYLCHLGSAYREAIVVSGPARGQMWADDTAGSGGFRPLLRPDGGRLSFTDWYRSWLETAELQVQS
ncbi:SMI1/KNR4 family protein [Actinoplanes sp. NPDC026619]|uniref:SMI1/KNR4 family protein n=1 Tax=Actinoplanes sp. NPDC026619 TaxID=3155798 RepID=UPI0033CAE378